MAIVEIDSFQHLRDMGFEIGFLASKFKAVRITSAEVDDQILLVMSSEDEGVASVQIGANGSLTFLDAYGTSVNFWTTEAKKSLPSKVSRTTPEHLSTLPATRADPQVPIESIARAG
ncbi:MAG: hypothetical protein AB3N13_01040 [Arenibacterium sp.]